MVSESENGKALKEIRELIEKALERERVEELRRERLKALYREKCRAAWEAHNWKMRDALPEMLREFFVPQVNEDQMPEEKLERARIEIPGLASILVGFQVNGERLSVYSYLVGRAYRNYEKEEVAYRFGSYDRVFSGSEIEDALLYAQRQAEEHERLSNELNQWLEQKRIMAEQEQKREQEWVERLREPVYETLDEEINNFLIEGIRGLIRQELAEVMK